MSCQKVRYETRKQAKQARARINLESKTFGLTVEYYCNDCLGWHHTSMEKADTRKLKKQFIEHSSKEVTDLRKAVRKHVPQPKIEKSWVAMVIIDKHGKVHYHGKAKGIMYENSKGETKFLMK